MEPFWRLLTYACLAWYATVTVYVAVLGATDVRTMLRRLEAKNDRNGDDVKPK